MTEENDNELTRDLSVLYRKHSFSRVADYVTGELVRRARAGEIVSVAAEPVAQMRDEDLACDGTVRLEVSGRFVHAEQLHVRQLGSLRTLGRVEQHLTREHVRGARCLMLTPDNDEYGGTITVRTLDVVALNKDERGHRTAGPAPGETLRAVKTSGSGIVKGNHAGLHQLTDERPADPKPIGTVIEWEERRERAASGIEQIEVLASTDADIERVGRTFAGQTESSAAGVIFGREPFADVPRPSLPEAHDRVFSPAVLADAQSVYEQALADNAANIRKARADGQHAEWCDLDTDHVGGCRKVMRD